MIIAWGILAFFGQYFARYFKRTKGWWFRIHVAVMTLCFIFTIVGFALIISYVTDTDGSQFKDVHQVFGIVIVFLTILQPNLGVIIDRLYNPKRKYVPIPDFIHHWIGRFVYVLAIVNIGLGLNLYCVTSIAIGFYVAAVFVFLVLIFYNEICRWCSPWAEYYGGYGPVYQIRDLQSFVLTFIGAKKKKKEEEEGDEKKKIFILARVWFYVFEILMVALIFLLWIGVIIEIARMDVPNPDPYYSSCQLDTLI